MTINSLRDLLRNRSSVYPNSYVSGSIDRVILEDILENANWAPTHKLTEPWRFQVFEGESLDALGAYMGNWYLEHTPEERYSERAHQKMQTNPTKAGAVIVIIMQRHEDSGLPEWEEIAAVAAAVQNMWLTATAYGLGAYWSSPKAIQQAAAFLELEPGQRCLGMFYLGRLAADTPMPGRERKPIAEKVRWRTGS